MLTWAARHRVAIWASAWGLAGAGFFMADIFSSPRRGPIWPAVVLGLTGWSFAGATTLDRVPTRGIAVWALAYMVAFTLGAIWGRRFEFAGALLAWAVGATLGAFLSGYLNAPTRDFMRSIGFAAIWGVAFFLAGYVSIVLGMLFAQAGKTELAFLGSDRAALTIGWTLGATVGGGLSSALGFRARDAIMGPYLRAG